MTYKKASQLKEEIFLLAHLFLVSKYAIKSSKQEEIDRFSNEIEGLIKEEVKTYSNKSYEQWQNIIAKLNARIRIDELIGEGKSSHKFILVLYAFTQELLDNGYQLATHIIDLFETFLEIENLQEMQDEDWQAVKSSADKRAKQLFKRLQNEALFII